MQRRDALKLGLGAGATAALAAALRASRWGAPRARSLPAIASLRIAPIDIDLAPGIKVRSIAFEGTVPGPQLPRGSEAATLEFRNDSDGDTVVHSSALAEPLITIPAHTRTRALLRALDETSTGVNFKAYRAYCAASGATAGGVTAQGTERVALAFDHLHVLSIHRWQPRPIARPAPFNETAMGYAYASFNDKLLCASEPIKVRYGDRVRFHFSNTSNLRGVTLGLAQHRFLVVALDGHPVPTPHHVERIYVGPAESVDAIVTMDRPGRWILGAMHREDRAAGLGRMIEYAGATGDPVESEFGIAAWDYGAFGCAEVDARPTISRRDATLRSLQLVRRVALTDPQLRDPTPQVMPIEVSAGRRYRFITTNLTRDPQSLQLLNHAVELVCVAGRQTAGTTKDVVTLPSFTRVEFEFEARASEVFVTHSGQVSLG